MNNMALSNQRKPNQNRHQLLPHLPKYLDWRKHFLFYQSEAR